MVPQPFASNPSLSSFEFNLLPSLQLTCPSIPMMLSYTFSLLGPVPHGNAALLCDTSTGSLRPLVPLQLRCQLFFMLFLTLEFEPLEGWFPPVLLGLTCPVMLVSG